MFLRMLFYPLLFLITSSLCSCVSFGPPDPQRHTIEYLTNIGINKDIIKRVVVREMLTENEYEQFSAINDENVRFMIATNPYTPILILSSLADDKSDLVLQGVLRNKRLPVAELNKHLNSQDLIKYIVGNPALPKKTILKIYHDRRNIPLFYYALNPLCPNEIKQAIQKSDDSLAKKWIKIHSSHSQSN